MAAICISSMSFSFLPSKVKSFSIACEATTRSKTFSGNFYPVKELKEYEDKVDKIKKLVKVKEEEDPVERLKFVDTIERLGVAHHYQEEIHTILEQHYAKNGDRRCCSLHDAALSFRLLRRRGFPVSADVFKNFKGKDGRFKGEIRQDIGGLLELYEATQLSFEGENILDEAEEFSHKILSAGNDWSEIVNTRLKHPYHMTITRLTHSQRHLQSTKTWANTLTQLAEMDFAVAQSLHRHELRHFSTWWDDLGIARELKLARNEPLKWYAWSMAILIHDISSSWQRVQITKCIAFVYLIDDVFDLYGTPQELAIFTQAVHKWDYAAMETLPQYMRTCYKALLDTTNEISHMICKKHGHNPIDALKRTWGDLCKAFLVEAKWHASKKLPRAEDYLANGRVSSGVHVVLVHLFFLLGHHDAIHLDDTSTLISCVAAILRLWDDLEGPKDEHENAKDGSYIECYMKDHQGLTPEQARERVMKMIRNEWKRLNKECFNLINSAFAGSSFQEASLNLARMVSLMYSCDGNQRLPTLDRYINSMLINQAPIDIQPR